MVLQGNNVVRAGWLLQYVYAIDYYMTIIYYLLTIDYYLLSIDY